MKVAGSNPAPASTLQGSSVKVALGPRNQQDPTAVLRDESGGIFLGECQDGGQGADQDDVGLAAFRPLSNLNPIDQRPDDVHGLRARRVVGQKGRQFADLFGVELADIRVHFHRTVSKTGAKRPFQVPFAGFQGPQFVPNDAGDLPPSKWSGLTERIWCILTLEKEE